jgi:hypothetical protein
VDPFGTSAPRGPLKIATLALIRPLPSSMQVSIAWELSVSGSTPGSKAVARDTFVTPLTFVLPDLLSIVETVFDFATSPYQASAEEAGRRWLHDYVRRRSGYSTCADWPSSHKAVPDKFINKFLQKGNFGRLASMSFATADEEHFIVAYKYYL